MNRHMSVLLVLVDPVVSPPVQPYGLQAVAAALGHLGMQSQIVWPHLEARPVEVLHDSLALQRPSIVGLSFRNLDTAGFHHSEPGETHFLDVLAAMVEEVHRANAIPVIGGSGFSIAPDKVLEYVKAPIGFVGPSESEFAEFCHRVVNKGVAPEAAVQGLSSAFIYGQSPPTPQRLPLLSPRQMDLRSVEYAKLVGGMVPVRTKTGCTLRCVYCVVPSIERLNLRPWADIREELQLVVDAGLGNRVFIADGEFNLPSVGRAIDLCHRIQRHFGNSVEWRCYLEAGYVTPELVAALVEANCIGVSLTVDSFHDEPRKGFAKGTSASMTVQAVEFCMAAGFRNVLANLLFGGPRETVATARHSAEVAAGFLEEGVGVNVTVGLRVYPGTPFAKLVTLPQFVAHYRPSNSVDWLGVFCSPFPAPELARHVEKVLHPDGGTTYNHTQSDIESAVFEQIAIGSGLLYRNQFDEAEKHFSELITQHGQRPELELGLLKAQEHISESGEIPRDHAVELNVPP